MARRRKRKVAAKRKPKRRRTLYERLKDYPLPPLPPEQAQAFKEIARQTREAQARAVVYKTELLDRMLAAEVSGRAPAPAPKKKRRKKRPPGRPPDYEYDKMERIAEDYIPTVAEFVPGYEASGWYGIGAPKNTPVEIVEKLNKETDAALVDPKMKARLLDLGGTVLAGSPADFGKLISDETEKWGKVIRVANIKLQ